jgi:hypothetical protein
MTGVGFLILALSALRAEAGDVNFTGHYELADKKADSVFSLDVTQTGTHADLSFSASMEDGSGAAPDGDGKGQLVNPWEIDFTFKDSFGNEGTGKLWVGKIGWHLMLTPTKVVEPRAVRFYGFCVLRKTSDKVQSDGA